MKEDTETREKQIKAFVALDQEVRDGAVEKEDALYDAFEKLTAVSPPLAVMSLADGLLEIEWQTAVYPQKIQYHQAIAQRKLGYLPQAINIFSTLLTAPNLDNELKGRVLNSIAICYSMSGQLEQAYEHQRAALAHWERLDDRLNKSKVHLNLGITCYKLRQYDTAVTHLEAAHQAFTELEQPSLAAITRNELGIVYRDLGEWDKAEANFEQLIAQMRQEDETENVASGLINLGEIQMYRGAFALAEQSFAAALSLVLSPTYKNEILINQGLIAKAQSDFATAETKLEAARQLSEEMGQGDVLPHIYYHLAMVAQAMGQADTARELLETAVSFIESTRKPMKQEAIKISLLGLWQQIYEALVLHSMAQGNAEAAFDWAERARARAFAEAVAHMPLTDSADPLATIADIQRTLDDETAVLCYFTTGVLENDMPMLQKIPKDNSLKQHLLSPAHIICFAISKQQVTATFCDMNPNLFSANSPRGFDVSRMLKTAVLQTLYAKLCHVDTLPLDGKKIVVIPHGPLHRVPFTAVLETGLSHAPQLMLSPSGTLFARGGGMRSAKTSGALVAGYNGLLHGKRLLYSEAEVVDINNLLDGELLLGDGAKKEVLRETAVNKTYLHLACHGFFDVENPMQSYLETGQGERLTAEEILSDWHLNARLVTLSACQTGVSQILRGDEPMGLVRAFLYAGAQAVLVTQWEVDDLATALLMGHFYRQLVAGETAVRSLHLSQLWLKELTAVQATTFCQLMNLSSEKDQRLVGEKRPFANPIFWAGFVMVSRG